MWDLGLWPEIEPRPPALGAWSLSQRTPREVPIMVQFYKWSASLSSFYLCRADKTNFVRFVANNSMKKIKWAMNGSIYAWLSSGVSHIEREVISVTWSGQVTFNPACMMQRKAGKAYLKNVSVGKKKEKNNKKRKKKKKKCEHRTLTACLPCYLQGSFLNLYLLFWEFEGCCVHCKC